MYTPSYNTGVVSIQKVHRPQIIPQTLLNSYWTCFLTAPSLLPTLAVCGHTHAAEVTCYLAPSQGSLYHPQMAWCQVYTGCLRGSQGLRNALVTSMHPLSPPTLNSLHVLTYLSLSFVHHRGTSKPEFISMGMLRTRVSFYIFISFSWAACAMWVKNKREEIEESCPESGHPSHGWEMQRPSHSPLLLLCSFECDLSLHHSGEIKDINSCLLNW